MKPITIEEIEKIILTWLSSDDENLTNVAHQIEEFCKRYAIEVAKETVEVCKAHCDDGHFDYEGALSNSLNIIKP